MGFLNKKEGIIDIRKELDNRKMKEWAEKYPLAALMISDRPYEYKLRYAEETYNTN